MLTYLITMTNGVTYMPTYVYSTVCFSRLIIGVVYYARKINYE